jgi:hypothetical protein
VVIVTFSFLLVIAGFVLLAVPPVSHEVQSLVTNYPRYKAELASGKGSVGSVVSKLHLTSYFKGKSQLNLSVAGGVLGAGKVVLSLGVATIAVVVLTVYFLIALPGVKRLWLSLVPLSRRERVGLLTDEVFDRVGGFMLGNLLTSLVAGIGTYVWLSVVGIPYALLLSLLVALFDLVPMVGSTIAGGCGHASGTYEGCPHWHRHGRLLHRLPLRRGLSVEPEGDEAHSQGEPGLDYHRHADRGHLAGPDRGPRRDTRRRHVPTVARGGGLPPPEQALSHRGSGAWRTSRRRAAARLA